MNQGPAHFRFTSTPLCVRTNSDFKPFFFLHDAFCLDRTSHFVEIDLLLSLANASKLGHNRHRLNNINITLQKTFIH